jgi:NIMA (never in mitosis gene a)-related kinase 1/4/5
MDKYEKIKQIGEGAYGKALLVRSKLDGKQHVIKEVSLTKVSALACALHLAAS